MAMTEMHRRHRQCRVGGGHTIGRGLRLVPETRCARLLAGLKLSRRLGRIALTNFPNRA